MASTAQTLNQLVTFLTKERRNSDQTIRDILISSHPAFQRLKTLLKVSYRVFFTGRNELNAWLKARGFTPVEEETWDDPKFEEWISTNKELNKQQLLKVKGTVFDQHGNLKINTQQEWDDDWIKLEVSDTVPEIQISDDEIPF